MERYLAYLRLVICTPLQDSMYTTYLSWQTRETPWPAGYPQEKMMQVYDKYVMLGLYV